MRTILFYGILYLMNMKNLKLINKLKQNYRQLSSKAYALPPKTVTSVIAIMIFFLSSGLLFAEEQIEKKPRIVIFNFQMVKPSLEESEEIKRRKNHSYYSIILPETISKKLQESDRFLINRDKKYLLNNEPDSIDTIRQNYSEELTAAAKQTSSDYVITGQFEVKNNILYVRIFIFNSLLNDLQEVTASEEETGIYLKDTPDSLSEGIEERIKDIIVEQIDKDKKTPLPSLSEYASIGFDAGYLFLSGEWADLYDNTQYYSPYISLNITSFLDMVFKFDHFSSNSDDSIISGYDSSLSVLGGSVLLNLKYQIFSNMGIYLNAGGGIARSEISINTGDPFTVSPSIKKDSYPSAEAGLGFKINLSSFYMRAGVSYKRIFFDKDPMDLRIIYGGAGIHF